MEKQYIIHIMLKDGTIIKEKVTSNVINTLVAAKRYPEFNIIVEVGNKEIKVSEIANYKYTEEK
mgnify:CR=1 FL=1